MVEFDNIFDVVLLCVVVVVVVGFVEGVEVRHLLIPSPVLLLNAWTVSFVLFLRKQVKLYVQEKLVQALCEYQIIK